MAWIKTIVASYISTSFSTLSRVHDYNNDSMLDGLELYTAYNELMPTYQVIEDMLEDGSKVRRAGKTAAQIEVEEQAATVAYWIGMNHVIRESIQTIE